MADRFDNLFYNVYAKEQPNYPVIACGLTAQTLILWVKRIVVAEVGQDFDISPAAYHYLMPMVKCVFFDMLDRSWVQWCTFIGYLAAGAKSYRSSNPQITGDEILLKMSQTITEAIICFRSGQVPGPNASSEASGDDVDGEADASAENNDKASKGR